MSSKKGSGSSGQAKKHHNLKALAKHTQLCWFHVAGACTRGDSCSVAHGEQDLQPTPDLSKTRLCKMFKKGRCKDAGACIYAHSVDELRAVPRAEGRPREQTAPVVPMKGRCKDAGACSYAHSVDELQAVPKAEGRPSEQITPVVPMTASASRAQIPVTVDFHPGAMGRSATASDRELVTLMQEESLTDSVETQPMQLPDFSEDLAAALEESGEHVSVKNTFIHVSESTRKVHGHRSRSLPSIRM